MKNFYSKPASAAGALARFFWLAILVALVLAGCAQQKERLRACPGAASVSESLDLLQQKAVAFKAAGQCLWERTDEQADTKKENLNVKLWVNPPCEIYLQGEVGLDGRAIVLGANEQEFWLLIKPQLGTYRWGRWDEQQQSSGLEINPKVLMESFGIFAADQAASADEHVWNLSMHGPYDILTLLSDDGRAAKKVYVYNCDYKIRRIEYLDDTGRVCVFTELGDYAELADGFAVPKKITLVSSPQQGPTDSFTLTLGSLKTAQLTDRLKAAVFSRPKTKGFDKVFRIVNGRLIEQPDPSDR